MRKLILVVALLIGGPVLAEDGVSTFTLYRSSPADPLMRVHMATFDAVEPLKTYNRDNCWLVADMFMEKVGGGARYWCEPGEYVESR